MVYGVVVALVIGVVEVWWRGRRIWELVVLSIVDMLYSAVVVLVAAAVVAAMAAAAVVVWRVAVAERFGVR